MKFTPREYEILVDALTSHLVHLEDWIDWDAAEPWAEHGIVKDLLAVVERYIASQKENIV